MTDKDNDQREFRSRADRFDAEKNETQEFASFNDYKSRKQVEYENLHQEMEDRAEWEDLPSRLYENSNEAEDLHGSTSTNDNYEEKTYDEEKAQPLPSRSSQGVNFKLPNNWGVIAITVVVALLLVMIVVAIFIPRDRPENLASQESENSLVIESSESSQSSKENSEESSEESDLSEESSQTLERQVQEPIVQNIPSETYSQPESYYSQPSTSSSTQQPTESHPTDYTSGSDDRQAIKSAASSATGISPDTMVEHWVGNDGSNQGVYATVSDGYDGQQYRVHVKWVEGAGWQASGVEPAH